MKDFESFGLQNILSKAMMSRIIGGDGGDPGEPQDPPDEGNP